MRICYFGTYRPEYMRNQINMAALQKMGVDIFKCHQPLWRTDMERIQVVVGGWKNPLFWMRLFTVYVRLIWQYLRVPDHDLVILGYPGHLDVFIAKALTLLRRKPLVWDVILSVVQVSRERGLNDVVPFSLKLLRFVEGIAIRLPDLCILDTPFYVEWFQNEYHLSPTGVPFEYLLIGADDRFFREAAAPTMPEQHSSSGRLRRVIYSGSFIPNHGVPTILEAARLLTDDPTIQFVFIGSGIGKKAAQVMAESYRLDNVTFIDWLDKSELIEQLRQADIILGAFGNTTHSRITIHNKIFEGMALGKPVLTGDSPAVRKFLLPDDNVVICPQADPKALACSIRQLIANPERRYKIGLRARKSFLEKFTLEEVGRNYLEILNRHFHLPMKSYISDKL